jgi:Outer membrane protein beta-barrel domain
MTSIKVFFLICFLYVFVFYSNGQSDVGSPKPSHSPLTFNPTFQVLIGPTLYSPKFYYDVPNQHRKLKPGYMVGINLLQRVGKKVSLSLKFVFDNRRFKNVVPNPDPNNPDYATVANLKNDYLTLVFAPQYYFGNKQRFLIGVGGYFSSLLKSETSFIASSPSGTPTGGIKNTSDSYKKNDLGLSANVGYKFFTTEKISIGSEILTTFGLRNINKDFSHTSIPIQKNNSLSLLMNVVIKI